METLANLFIVTPHPASPSSRNQTPVASSSTGAGKSPSCTRSSPLAVRPSAACPYVYLGLISLVVNDDCVLVRWLWINAGRAWAHVAEKVVAEEDAKADAVGSSPKKER